jgi:hypothetical protein
VTGEHDLRTLLASMRPVVRAGEFVFVSRLTAPDVECEATVREDEGLTCLVRREVADAQGWTYDFVAGWITLRVHSALAAIGLTAAVSEALADRGISCNVVAGYFHDHLLVPAERVGDAMAALEDLSSGPRGPPG